jgi:glycosyltransferase involved in cell wall biosynthesis
VSGTPFFSICVPQYNRTPFLIEACREWSQQTCRDFEICISDDCSLDGRLGEVTEFLERSGLKFRIIRQEKNLRYDGNLRAAIALATGQYCLLMGNDDCAAYPELLAELKSLLLAYPNAGVVITNYEEYASKRFFRRVSSEGVAGSGPALAGKCFRNFSFVSGVLLRRDRCHAHATARWDGSEMYQMYLGCRIIAEGYDVLEFPKVCIRQGIQLPGESVDSYARRPKLNPCPVVERKIPLVQMGRLVYDAVRPHSGSHSAQLGARIFLQILLFTYPFWILEYRRVQSWKYALGICLGMRPRYLLEQVRFPVLHQLFLRAVYVMVTFAGLVVPVSVFDVYRPKLYRFAKSVFQNG